MDADLQLFFQDVTDAFTTALNLCSTTDEVNLLDYMIERFKPAIAERLKELSSQEVDPFLDHDDCPQCDSESSVVFDGLEDVVFGEDPDSGETGTTYKQEIYRCSVCRERFYGPIIQ